MNRDEREELAAAYALDALPGGEARAFERELRDDADLQALVDDLKNTGAALAAGIAPLDPPLGIKERVLAQIHAEKPAPPVAGRLGWAVAACLAVALAILGFAHVRLVRHAAGLQAHASFSDMKIAALHAALDQYSKGSVVVVWNPETQRGVLKAEGMPPLDPDRDYQLWVVDPSHKNPVDGGVFSVNADGIARVNFKPATHVNSAQKFAISLERKGGVPKAEGPIVMIGE